MIDPTTEQLISLTTAAKSMPARRGGKRPTVSCIYRWTTKGCRGIILESLQCGATRCTSHAALARFFTALSDASLPPKTATTIVRSSARREREIATANLELDRADI